MAAQAPAVPVVVPVPAPGNPFFDQDPVYLPAGHPLVAATGAFLAWQPVVAAPPAPAQMSVPAYALLFSFGIRCRVSPLPADQLAARGANPFTLRLHAAYWSRMLTELCASGLAPPGTVYGTVSELHDAIAGLSLQNPNQLLIVAADWNLAPGLAAPGAGAAQAAARVRFTEISFLAAASVTSLEIASGPRARTAPWAAISLLTGALGPVGRNPLRLAPDAPTLIVAAEIRGSSTAQDAVLTASLRQVLVSALLPAAFRSHSADQPSVLSELQAGLRYRLTEDDKSAVEEQRIYYIRPRYPTIALAVIDLGVSESQIVGTLRILQRAMLPAQLHEARLADILERLESQLASRRPTLNLVLAQANPTVDDVTAAILAENAVMAQAGASAANNIVGNGAPGGGADADGLALSKQAFKDVAAALGRFDLTSESGQRDAIASILVPGECLLAMRILLHHNPKGADVASSRDATCIAINGLRPQLFNYFNYSLRLDTTGLVPVLLPQMKPTATGGGYSFATATSREDPNSLLSLFLRFELDSMDWFEQPHGAGSWFSCLNVCTTREVITKPNYFVQVSNLKRIKSFVNVLLGAIGVPQALPAAPVSPGYTWPAFVDFYISKLELAAGLPLLLDQYEHIAACASIFQGALTALRQRLTSLIRDPNPSARTMQVPMFPRDSAAIQDLTTLETEIARKRAARGDLANAFKQHEGKVATATWEMLKLDDEVYTNHLKAKAKKPRVGEASTSLTFGSELSDLSGAGDDGAGLPPGSLAQSHRFLNGFLIISGSSWNIPGLAQHLKVPVRGAGSPCWPFLLAACADKNRMARCAMAGKPGHEDARSLNHVLIPNFDRHAMAALFSTPATPEQTAGLVKVPTGKGKGRGKGGGRGKGERGRGRQGGRQGGRGQQPPAVDAGTAVDGGAAAYAVVLAELDSLKRRLAAHEQPDPKLSSPAARMAHAGGRHAQLQYHPEPPPLLPYRPPTPEPADADETELIADQLFERPPQVEPPAGGLYPRLNQPVIRNFRLVIGDVAEDLAITANLARLLRELPVARQNSLAATNLRELQSPLKTLAASVSAKGKFVVDCGGQGQCGPNTIAYLLGLVGRAEIDGPQLRRAVVQHAMVPAHRARVTRFRDRQKQPYTLEGLILRCMEDNPGSGSNSLTQTVRSWCQDIAKPASWTDLAFLQVAADCYGVAIYIHTVDDLSTLGNLGVILPCSQTVPTALLEVGMWIGRHLVAVVTADGTSGRAAPGQVGGARPYEPPAIPPLTLQGVRDLLLTAEAPTVLVACEFSGALTTVLQAQGHRTLSCDLRPALHRFPHYQGDVRAIVGLQRWERAYFFPNCFQHLRGDDRCLPFKIDDCRAFWAAAMVLWCLSCPHARVVIVEQPDTIVYDYVDVTTFASLFEFHTSQYGDPAQSDKFVRLAIRNARLCPPTQPIAPQHSRPTHLDYPDPDARDRARSSWAPHVLTCNALANLAASKDNPPAPSYPSLIAAFASSWFRNGHPVPKDYLAPDAQPSSLEWRRYQEVRGPGDGRRPPVFEPPLAPIGDGGWDDGLGDSDIDPLLQPSPNIFDRPAASTGAGESQLLLEPILRFARSPCCARQKPACHSKASTREAPP